MLKFSYLPVAVNQTIFQYMHKLFDPILHHPILFRFKIPPTHNITFLRMTKYHCLEFVSLTIFLSGYTFDG